MEPTSFDHVALWVSERDAIADLLCTHLGMHEIDRTDDFTLCGVDAKLGKLTLFDAEGPREAGALERIVLRVADLDRAVTALPGGIDVRREDEVAAFAGPDGLPLGLVAGSGADYDLDHVLLRVSDVPAAAAALGQLGFSGRDGRLSVAD